MAYLHYRRARLFGLFLGHMKMRLEAGLHFDIYSMFAVRDYIAYVLVFI